MLEEITRLKERISMPGINFFIHDYITFIVSSERPLNTMSSAVIGGGMGSARHIINHTVDKGYNGSNPEHDLRQLANKLHLGPDVVGMMTAVSVTNTFISCISRKDLTVAALCTAGISNPGVAGLPISEVINRQKPGTINIILLIDGNLTGAAMINAVITATEAKTRALIKTETCLPDGEQVTGTTTDSIIVACTGRGGELSYAGTGTELGYLIGRTVFDSLLQGVNAYIASVSTYKD